MNELAAAIEQAMTDLMQNGVTMLSEATIDQPLGEPFRRSRSL